jgi:hypothetical protein
MNRYVRAAVSTAALLTLGRAGAASIEVCPPLLETTQTVHVPNGWKEFKSGYSNKLNSVRFFDAPPGIQTGGLMPDRSKDIKDGSHSYWNLAGMKDVWIVCEYYGSTNGIARPLGAVSGCEVTMTDGLAGGIAIVCQPAVEP